MHIQIPKQIGDQKEGRFDKRNTSASAKIDNFESNGLYNLQRE